MNETTDNYMVQFIMDENITEVLDQQLRNLLTICFPKEQIFARQRFLYEKAKYRWFAFNEQSQPVAHTALHIKMMKTQDGEYSFGGIAEVCVHPEYRRKGLVHALMDKVDEFLRNEKIPFALLFGEGKIYLSSGYEEMKNEIRYFDPKREKWIVEINKDARFKELSDLKWPEGRIDLQGPMF